MAPHFLQSRCLRLGLLVAVWLFFPGANAQAGTTAANTILGIDIAGTGESRQVTIRTSVEPTFTVFRLGNPMRVVVDVSGGDLSKLEGPITVEDGVIGQIATRQFRADGFLVGRVIVGLEQELTYSVRADGKAVVVSTGSAPAQHVDRSIPPPVAPIDRAAAERFELAKREAKAAASHARSERLAADQAKQNAKQQQQLAQKLAREAKKARGEAVQAKTEAQELRRRASESLARDREIAERAARQAEARLQELQSVSQTVSTARAEAVRMAAAAEQARREAEGAAAAAEAEHKQRVAELQSEIAKAKKDKAAAEEARQRAQQAKVAAQAAAVVAEQKKREAERSRAEVNVRLAEIGHREKELQVEQRRAALRQVDLNGRQSEIAKKNQVIEARFLALEKKSQNVKADKQKTAAERQRLQTLRADLLRQRRQIKADREKTDHARQKLEDEKRALTGEKKGLAHKRLEAEQARRRYEVGQRQVAQTQHALAGERQRLAEDSQKLDKRRVDLEKNITRVAQENARVQETKRQIAARRQEIKKALAGLQERQAKIDKAQASLHRTRDQIGRDKNALVAEQEKIAAQKADLLAATKDLEKRRQRLSTGQASKNRSASLRQKLAAERQQIAVAQAALTERQRELEDTRRELGERQVRVDTQARGLVEDRRIIAAERRFLSSERKLIAASKEELAQLKGELETRRSAMRRAESTLVKREQSVKERERSTKEARAAAAQARHELAAAEAKLRLAQKPSNTKSAAQKRRLQQEGERLATERQRLAAQKQTLEQQAQHLAGEQRALAEERQELEKDKRHLVSEEELLAQRRRDLEAAPVEALISPEPPLPVRNRALAALGDPRTAASAPGARPAELTGVQRRGSKDQPAILLALHGIPHFEVQRLEGPPRLVVDMADTKRVTKRTVFGVRSTYVRRVRLGDHGSMTRAVLDLTANSAVHAVEPVPEGLLVSLRTPEPHPASALASAAGGTSRLRDVRFDGRLAAGKSVARIVLDVDAASRARVDNRSQKAWVLELENAKVDAALEKSLDTSAYGTVVRLVSTYQSGPKAVKVVANLTGPAESELRREGGSLIWEIRANGQQRAITAAAAPQTAGFAATASVLAKSSPAASRKKRISIDLKDADIINVLRLLSEVSGENIITSDEVTGKITLRLRNVPWDKALDTILKAKGYDMVRQDNIMRIAPAEVIQRERERELDRKNAEAKVEETLIKIITVNYATASEISDQLKPMLSARGSVQVDDRTNTIVVEDIRSNIDRVVTLTRRLDRQTPQVLIEARIVEATSTELQQLGIQWGGTSQASSQTGNPTGLLFPSDIIVSGAADDALSNQSNGVTDPSRFAVNLPAPIGTGSGGGIGFVFGSAGGSQLINLRLTALEESGKGRIISSPRITTLDNRTATISQGVDFPVSVVSSAGANTSFAQARLKLEVTPHVTNDGSVLMKIRAEKNEPDFGNVGGGGDPSIVRKEAETEVLVRDGETTVIGGIYTRTTAQFETGIPWLSKIPILGVLFSSTAEVDTRSEMLIFVTPRIVNRDASSVSPVALEGAGI